MKNIFTALLKITGCFLVFYGVTNLFGSIMFFAQARAISFSMLEHSVNMPEWMAYVPAIQLLLFAFLYFAAAWLFVFKTGWVADKVKMPSDPDGCATPEIPAILHAGVKLLGIWALLASLPILKTLVISPLEAVFDGYTDFANCLREITRDMPNIVKFLLAVYCVWKTDNVVGIITGKKRVKWLRVAAIFLAILVFFALVNRKLATIDRGFQESYRNYRNMPQEDFDDSENGQTETNPGIRKHDPVEYIYIFGED